MKNTFLILFALLVSGWSLAQDSRRMLRGKVMYMSSNVPNENVINSTSGEATITDDNGEFIIAVQEGDQLVFTAVNYQLEIVKITPEILTNNRLVVEVNEKVRELDEVVVTPDNQERFLQVQNEEFKEFTYDIDRGTEVENVAESRTVRGMQDGLNFVNIFKALFQSNTKADGQERPPLKVSEVLRHVYDDEFFVADLRLPQDKIDAFLLYCDDKIPSQTILRKENEFQLIDFLVTQSKEYLATLEE
ncbi:carboxypeptidase-like regulatory domain-containing protein [Flagellimonas zhangzhouensis]|uniref:CarboxypepD_reg-like domain-containing protein n=1 Tax=Flagellimonas zhangzhouensis TaxID=1073328 RepID=A0A1H2YV36_9FLAO|nr:carboxypeptidase-like regulatory domain-containing protein [Allomuricauda zhangzhouensis]SDR05895.1 CarboxypepD_reg-like domain-containing protein [Allomuricauda zhangzhouensis]SDX08921.1 CarboxypepD_reg-like domain-containing protein [Allomuricauda zhangzhouensis]